MKEAEFIRNEILSTGTIGRTLQATTLTFIGVMLTVTGAVFGVRSATFSETMHNYQWLFWIISIMGIIACFTFLFFHIGSHAGIINAATYYRDELADELTKLLNTRKPILNWETWLGVRRRQGRPREELIATPFFFSLIGLVFAYWAFGIILITEGGIRCLFFRKGFLVGAVAWFSLLLIFAVMAFGRWAILNMKRIQRNFDNGLPGGTIRRRELG